MRKEDKGHEVLNVREMRRSRLLRALIIQSWLRMEHAASNATHGPLNVPQDKAATSTLSNQSTSQRVLSLPIISQPSRSFSGGRGPGYSLTNTLADVKDVQSARHPRLSLRGPF
jgi:hypothetical protein